MSGGPRTLRRAAVSNEAKKVTDFYATSKRGNIELPPALKRGRRQKAKGKDVECTEEEALELPSLTRAVTPVPEDKSYQHDESPRRRKVRGAPAAIKSALESPASTTVTTPVSVRSAKRRLNFGNGTDTETPVKPCTEIEALATASKQRKATVGAKLGAVRNLSALRAQLSSFSTIANRIQEQQQQHEKKVEKEYTEQVLSPTKKQPPVVTLEEEDGKSCTLAPAYERYAHLTEPSTSGLPMPIHYDRLLTTFRCLDVCTAMLHRREQRITYDMIRPSVQTMTRRDFTSHHLGQIRTVYPESYEFHYEQARQRIKRNMKISYELVITPTFENDLFGLPANKQALVDTPRKVDRSPLSGNNVVRFIPRSPQKSSAKSRPFLASPTKIPPRLTSEDASPEERVKLSGQRQLYRGSIFKSRLFDRVTEAHRKFLASLEPPITLAKGEVVERWHPRFALDAVEDVPVAEIQMPSGVEENVPQNAAELLAQIRNICETPVRNKMPVVQLPAPPVTPSTPKLKHVPESLLAKVRAKQAALELVHMRRDNAQEQYIARLKRGTDVVRMLRLLYMAENVASMPLDVVLIKLTQSYGTTVGREEMNATVETLTQVLPQWVQKVTLKGRHYLKIDKRSEPKVLASKIQEALEKAMNS